MSNPREPGEEIIREPTNRDEPSITLREPTNGEESEPANSDEAFREPTNEG